MSRNKATKRRTKRQRRLQRMRLRTRPGKGRKIARHKSPKGRTGSVQSKLTRPKKSTHTVSTQPFTMGSAGAYVIRKGQP